MCKTNMHTQKKEIKTIVKKKQHKIKNKAKHNKAKQIKRNE